jgi:hypothetical protein
MVLPNIVTAGATMTGVGSTTLPAQALVGSATNRLELVEISIVNTTAVACVWRLMKISSAGTPGTSLTSVAHMVEDPTTGVVKQAYTSTAPTTGVDYGYRFRIPGNIGAGVVRPLTAGGVGLVIPATAAAGIGLFIESGTGQLCDVDWSWVEM